MSSTSVNEYRAREAYLNFEKDTEKAINSILGLYFIEKLLFRCLTLKR